MKATTVEGIGRSYGRSVCTALLALLLAACGGGGGDSSNSVPTSVTGSVNGTVTDSDSNPIVGATVSYSGASNVSTTTGANGSFSLDGVVVSGLSVAGGNSITLVIDTSTTASTAVKYMNATIQVSPKAQVLPGNPPTFLSKFTVEAGTIQIPAMATTITGVLRDSASGSGISGNALGLTYEGSELSYTIATGVTVNLQPPGIPSVTTGSDGSFSIPQVYNDSCVRLTSADYQLISASGSIANCSPPPSADSSALTFSTTSAVKDTGGVNGSIALNNVTAQAFAQGDTTPPYVTKVEGAFDSTSNPEPLESSVTGVCPGGEIVVDFSEPMEADLDTSNVRVLSGSSTPLTLQSVTLGNNDTQLSICTGSALAVGSAFFVQIQREALKDQSSNQNGIVDNPGIAYDSFATTTSGAQVLNLNLKTTAPSF